VKLAVIVDNGALPRFGREAVDSVRGCDEVTVFSCTNTSLKRKALRHGAYYALNLRAVRNPHTRPVPVDALNKRISRRAEFESGYEGAWQTLPDAIIDELRGFDVILKFGMGLLRVPPPERLAAPILSYHHGDPDKFRGRPAGFWEMMKGEKVMGQIVQAIGNRLDAGRVAAFAETKVFPWSWRATLIEAYRHSPLILNEAVHNAIAGRWLAKPCTGRNYRLPSNASVARFALASAGQLAKRLLYGAFVEKRWQVSVAPTGDSDVHGLLAGGSFPDPASWRTLDVPAAYTFYADPFFSSDPPGILVEALRASTGIGEIVLVDDEHRRVSDSPNHVSYPATFDYRGRQFVVPEMVACSAPRIFGFENGVLSDAGPLKVAGEPRILDPTLIEHDGRLYLFGNDGAIGANVLLLWSAEKLDDEFCAHPASPIRVSPEGARMAGNVIGSGKALIRLGQDFTAGYGDGIIGFEIETLTPDSYRERLVGRLRFADRRGPHTLNLRDGEMVFDWYVDRLSPLASFRRLAARLRS
jgi:hypothetical protein